MGPRHTLGHALRYLPRLPVPSSFPLSLGRGCAGDQEAVQDRHLADARGLCLKSWIQAGTATTCPLHWLTLPRHASSRRASLHRAWSFSHPGAAWPTGSLCCRHHPAGAHWATPCVALSCGHLCVT